MDKFATYEQEQRLRRELVNWGKELYDQGLVKGSGGNLSIRMDENTVLLTPTGFFLGHMSEACISKCSVHGEHLDGCPPTKEVPLHLAAYEIRPNVRAVCHTHSIYATTFASMAEPGACMPVYVPSVAAKVGQVQVAPFAFPGSEELGEYVRNGILKSNAVLLGNHGVVAVGKDMETAVSCANEVENDLMIHFLSQGKARTLTESDLKHLFAKVSL